MKNKLFQLTLSLTLLAILSGCAPKSLQDDPFSEQQAMQEEGSPPAMDVPAFEEPSQAHSSVQALANYSHLDPNRVVPTDLLKKAVAYYDANKSRLSNKNYLSVIDFAAKSTKPRFYIVNMTTGSVWAIRTSHGKGSDSNHDGFAESFSNVSGSNKTSLGFYRTAETYSGQHGYSLRLDGLSTTNSKARSRAIVIHGASYVQDSSVVQGRSWGCPAVSMANRTSVINKIKGGSLIYAGLSGR